LLALVVVTSAACAPLDSSDVTDSPVFLFDVEVASSLDAVSLESEAVVLGVEVESGCLLLVEAVVVAESSVSSDFCVSFPEVVGRGVDVTTGSGTFPVGIAIELPAPSVEEAAVESLVVDDASGGPLPLLGLFASDEGRMESCVPCNVFDVVEATLELAVSSAGVFVVAAVLPLLLSADLDVVVDADVDTCPLPAPASFITVSQKFVALSLKMGISTWYPLKVTMMGQ
jgi:hypothetical protein